MHKQFAELKTQLKETEDSKTLLKEQSDSQLMD